MKLLVSLPVYNESAILEQSVRTVHEWCNRNCSPFDWELIIADNGSTDDTLLKANALARELPRVSVFHTDEKGRGQVMKRLWQSHEADIYTYMDVDLAVDLKAFMPLIESLATNEADVAIGSRFLKNARVKRSALREFTSRAYNFLVYLFLRLRVVDTQCGFKGINKKTVEVVLAKTTDPSWFWDTELLALAQYQGLRTKEIPVEWVETRTAGRKSKVALFNTIMNYLWNLWQLRKKLRTSQLEGAGDASGGPPAARTHTPSDQKTKVWGEHRWGWRAAGPAPRDALFAILIFVISFTTSIILADHQYLGRYFDQGNYLLAAKLISQGLVPHYDFAMGHFATYPWLLSLILRFGGSFEMLRWFSFGVNAATLVALFFLAKQFCSRSRALLITAVIYFSLIWFLHSSLVLLDFPTLLCLTLSILIPGKQPNRNKTLISGLLFGLAVITKITMMVPLSALLFILLISGVKKYFTHAIKNNTPPITPVLTFIIGVIIPVLGYLLLLGPREVWNDIFAFHLSQQSIMSSTERLRALVELLIFGFLLIIFVVMAVVRTWNHPDWLVRVSARVIPMYFFLVAIQRSIYSHHTLLLLTFFVIVLTAAIQTISRPLLLRLSMTAFIVSFLLLGILRFAWYNTNMKNQKQLVSFIENINQPIFTWTPFWVLAAGGTVEPWYYMATSDMAAKRGTTLEEWKKLFEKSPYIIVDKRTKAELLLPARQFIEKNFTPIFVNQDFTVYQNPLPKPVIE